MVDDEVAVPRSMLIAQAWEGLGESVAPLSNPAGKPLARTMKLIIEPLVLRPRHDRRFSGPTIAGADAEALRAVIAEHGDRLAGTAAWFRLVKQARRRLRITTGNPQDLYFQRCYEWAHLHGHPDEEPERAVQRAMELIGEVASERGGNTPQALREHLTGPRRPELRRRLASAWRHRPGCPAMPDGAAADLERLLAECPSKPDARLFARLAGDRAGSAAAAVLDGPGAAREHGLTGRDRITVPELGDRASKQQLPRPFDRSILERIFAVATTARHVLDDLDAAVTEEITRSAEPWQLSDEHSRITMVLGDSAIASVTGTDPVPAGHPRHRLRSRWQREAYVHRVSRLPEPEAESVPAELRAEIVSVRQPYLRRLWVRAHGRELRGEPVDADQLWDTLDGVLRSVVMDQRDRLRHCLGRDRT